MGGHEAAAAAAAVEVALAVVVLLAGVAAGERGFIGSRADGAMQINSSDPLMQPVLLNGEDVLSIIKEQASINAVQASMLNEQSSVIESQAALNANLTLRITSLEQEFCRLQEPKLDWIQGAGSGPYKWNGGVLAPNGLIYGVPHHATSVLIINPAANTRHHHHHRAPFHRWQVVWWCACTQQQHHLLFSKFLLERVED